MARRKTLHFKSKAAFERYNAFRFMHLGKSGGHKKGKPYPKVEIRGRQHKVQHKGNKADPPPRRRTREDMEPGFEFLNDDFNPLGSISY